MLVLNRVLQPVISPVLKPIFGVDEEPVTRSALNFNGTSIGGILDFRAMNVSNDIDIEWEQRNVNPTGWQAIVTQCLSSNPDARELELEWLNGKLWFEVGGSLLLFGIDNVLISDGKWRITLIGSTVTVYKNDVVVFTINRNRGFTREPSAPTRIGAINVDGVFSNYFQGILYNVKINGRLWAMDVFNNSIQPSVSVGNNMTILGATESNWVDIQI